MSKNEFLKILIPADDSTSSLMAEETAAIIAKKTGASLTVLHVMQEFPQKFDVAYSIREEILNHIEQLAKKVIDNARILFKEEKIEIDTKILSGDPADTILNFSKSDYNLIIIGACGEHEKDTCILGSVTKKIIRHTPCPTLIVKKVSSLSNLLVCTDGSEHALKAIKFSAELAEKMGSNITLLNVQDETLHKVSPKDAENFGERILSRSMKVIEGRKLNVQKKLEFGVPTTVIVETAEKGDYDLIVLGSRGLGTIYRFILGGVSDDVSHKAKCSVLIVPSLI